MTDEEEQDYLNNALFRIHPMYFEYLLPPRLVDIDWSSPFNPYRKIQPYLPIDVPEKLRFEHTYIVAPTGYGKTTLLSSLVNRDLDKVARGEASIIVIDSKLDLIGGLVGLKRFAPGGDLHGKLVYLNSQDVEWPIALNPFSMSMDDFNNPTPEQQQGLEAAAISTFQYIFKTLLGAELTSGQNTLFSATARLLMSIPGATVNTFIELMQPKALQRPFFKKYVAGLHKDLQMYFAMKFEEPETQKRKSEVANRLFATKNIDAMRNMFNAPSTKINFFKEMGQGKVIVINLAESLLQKEGVETVGRFFLAMISLAIKKRQLIPDEERLPTYLYMDEFHKIASEDVSLRDLLTQARAFGVGMVLANQIPSDLSPDVMNTVIASTAIKFAAGLDDNQAATIARAMGATPEFIKTCPHYTFAFYARSFTKSAIRTTSSYLSFKAMPQMSSADALQIRDEMHRYCNHISQLEEQDNLPAIVEPEIIPPAKRHQSSNPTGPTIVIPPGTEVTHRTRKASIKKDEATFEETETTIRPDHEWGKWG